MKLTVRNFGPIRRATVDVSPMTIFVGPSNTGKSYLAILIYSIVKALGDVVIRQSYYQGLKHKSRQEEKLEKLIPEISKEIFGNHASLPRIIQKQADRLVNEFFLSWTEITVDSLKDQIIYCFGEEGKKIIENSEDLVISITGPGNALTLNLASPDKSKLNDKAKAKIVGLMAKEIHNDIVKLFSGQDEPAHDNPAIAEASYMIFAERWSERNYAVFSTLLLGDERPFDQAHYLPALRDGIMQNHQALIRDLIERAPTAGLSERFPSIPLFTGVLSDFMTKLINIESDSGRTRGQRTFGLRGIFEEEKSNPQAIRKIRKIGSRIENRIMDGSIDVQLSTIHYPNFRYKFRKGEQDYNLPLMSASSMVSELAPVSLFIRHYLCSNDLFILEEPEAHLHPAAQREISNALVQLVNAGVHVLITTHSSVILEQIGNCIQATNVPEIPLARKMNKAGKTLKESDASVYLFPKQKRGRPQNTVVRKTPFDPETGILTKDHLDSSSDLYNEIVSLLNGE